MTYCNYEGCPLTACEKHPKKHPADVEAEDQSGNCYNLWAWREQRKGMRVGEAYSIFHNIDDPEITDEEKGLAIWRVVRMETHNSVAPRTTARSWERKSAWSASRARSGCCSASSFRLPCPG